jgi:hypothetical protein
MVLAPERQAVQDRVKYRRPGEDAWSEALAVNLSATGLLFRTCALIPEINSRLEMYFDGDATAQLLTGRVARRVLHCWPDPCVQIAVQFIGSASPKGEDRREPAGRA